MFVCKRTNSDQLTLALLYSHTNWPSECLCKSFCLSHLKWIYFTASNGCERCVRTKGLCHTCKCSDFNLFVFAICNTMKCTKSNSHCNKHFQLKMIDRNMSCKHKVVVHFLLILYNQLHDTKILFAKDKIKKKSYVICLCNNIKFEKLSKS